MKNKKKAFTLIELIVVMSILIILGTIGIVSYDGYTFQARDANRNTELTNIKDSIEIYKGMYSYLPVPENYVKVKAGTSVINYQGYAGSSILDAIKMNKGGQDPKDNVYYTYTITSDKLNYQLMAFLEDGGNLQTKNNLINKTNAVNYTSRIPTVIGNRVGILTESGTNTPIQDISTLTTNGLDITTTTNNYTTYFSNTDIVSGTGQTLTTIFTSTDKTLSSLDSSLVGYWDMETLTGTLLRDFSGYNNNGIFSGSISAGNIKGKIGYATSLNGAGGIIEIPNNASLNPTNITVCAWAQRNGDNTANWVQIIYKEDWTGKLGYNLTIDKTSDNLLFRTLGSSTNYDLTTNNVKLASMNYYCGIFTTGILTSYKNGVKSGTMTGTMATSSVNLTLGGASTTDTLNGIIDDVRIYNRALSDAEIESLYNTITR